MGYEKALTTDQAILSKLRSMEHWTTVEPWKSMADRFEELSELEADKEESDDKNMGV